MFGASQIALKTFRQDALFCCGAAGEEGVHSGIKG
jgi:hypothetical protein